MKRSRFTDEQIIGILKEHQAGYPRLSRAASMGYRRGACGLAGIDLRVYRYRSTRPDNAELCGRLKELASQRRRFGYRRLHILLRREGVEVKWKKLYRLYREERLVVRKRGLGNSRADGNSAGPEPALEPRLCLRHADRWPSLPHPCVIDDFSREC